MFSSVRPANDYVLPLGLMRTKWKTDVYLNERNKWMDYFLVSSTVRFTFHEQSKQRRRKNMKKTEIMENSEGVGAQWFILCKLYIRRFDEATRPVHPSVSPLRWGIRAALYFFLTIFFVILLVIYHFFFYSCAYSLGDDNFAVCGGRKFEINTCRTPNSTAF